jgi:hypothetical protein
MNGRELYRILYQRLATPSSCSTSALLDPRLDRRGSFRERQVLEATGQLGDLPVESRWAYGGHCVLKLSAVLVGEAVPGDCRWWGVCARS